MALARWTPMSELSTLHSSIDRIFNDLFETSMGDPARRPALKLPEQPLAIDVMETKDGYEVKAPVPGFKPEEVDVSVRDGILTISARHSQEREQEEGGYIRRETFTGNFIRSLQLPPDVTSEDVKAEVEDGVLTLRIPRRRNSERSRVQVKRKQSGQAAASRN